MATVVATTYGSLPEFEKEETDREYLGALRKLAIDCDLANKEIIEEALRDRLVGGVRNMGIQKILLSIKDLTFSDACETAKAMEAAETNSKAIASGTAKPSVLQVTQQCTKTVQKTFRNSRWDTHQVQPCYHCGKVNHSSSDYRFKEAHCHYCGKIGHVATICRSRLSSKQQGFSPKTLGKYATSRQNPQTAQRQECRHTKANYLDVESD